MSIVCTPLGMSSIIEMACISRMHIQYKPSNLILLGRLSVTGVIQAAVGEVFSGKGWPSLTP